MKSVALVATFLAVLTTSAMADQKYDTRIDEAAARIVAGKIGEIRGGFAPGEEPVFVKPDTEARNRAVEQPYYGWQRGLARAREPGTYVSVSF